MATFFPALSLFLLTLGAVSSEECPYTDETDLLDGVAWVRHGFNPVNQTVSIEMTYAGQGWVGFGFSSTGSMVGSTTVIGLPDEAVSSTNPASYYLASYSLTDATITSPGQTLTNTNVVQNATHTRMTFTQPLTESGELSVSTSAENTFIWAYGFSNALGSHVNRGKGSLSLKACDAATDDTNNSSTTTQPPSNNSSTQPPSNNSTQPPATNSSSTQPPATNSSSTQPPAKNSSSTQPPANNSSATQPPANNSSSTQPPANNSSSTQPPNSSKECPYTDETDLLDGVAFVRHGFNPVDQTVSIEMTYAGQGWVGFGFSSTGSMVGSTTVIGLPDEAVSSTNPASYYLASYSLTDATITSPGQTLTNTNVVQNATHTVMTFTQPLTESGELSVSTSAENTFIWAYGFSNALGSHVNRGKGSLSLKACDAATDDTNNSSTTTQPPTNNNSSTSSGDKQVGDLVCFEGFVMDEYCINLGILLDNPTVPTLVGPDTHSVHCLVDVAECLASDWELLGDPLSSDSNYTRAFVLDSDGKSKVVDIAKSVGVCDICNGTVARGLRVQIRGSVKSLGSGDEPPTVQVADVQASSGSLNQAFCSGSIAADPAPAPTQTKASPTSAPSGDISQGNLFTLEGGRIKLRIEPNITGSNMFVEMTYAGQGWLGFGFSSDGKMVGATSVIGLPGSGSDPTLYYHGSTALSDTKELSADKQTLQGASITQNATHTVLAFTKNFVDLGIVEITPTSVNQFIYAHGASNTLGFHPGRSTVSIDLSNLNSGIQVSGGGSNTRKLWVAHGVMMCVAWGILVPLAIGASLLRSLLPLPEGTWFKIHYSLNSFAMSCLIVGFALSVRAVSEENGDHFKEDAHRTIGLVIFLASFVQIGSGFLRPHLPHKPQPTADVDHAEKGSQQQQQQHNHNHSMEEVNEIVKEVEEVAKSTARIVWEYQHRILGAGLVGLSWYNCTDGLELYAARYGEDLTGAFWGVVGGLTGAIFIGFAYSKLEAKKN